MEIKSDTQKSTDELAIELFDLREQVEQPYLSEKRKESIRRRMAVVSFELSYHDDEPPTV